MNDIIEFIESILPYPFDTYMNNMVEFIQSIISHPFVNKCLYIISISLLLYSFIGLLRLGYLARKEDKEYRERFDKYRRKYKDKILYSATSTFWANLNPILNKDEVAYESNTNLIKMGNGKTPIKDLTPYDYIVDPDELEYIFNNAVLPSDMWTCDKDGKYEGVLLRRPMLQETGKPNLRLVKSVAYNSENGCIEFEMDSTSVCPLNVSSYVIHSSNKSMQTFGKSYILSYTETYHEYDSDINESKYDIDNKIDNELELMGPPEIYPI